MTGSRVWVCPTRVPALGVKGGPKEPVMLHRMKQVPGVGVSKKVMVEFVYQSEYRL